MAERVPSPGSRLRSMAGRRLGLTLIELVGVISIIALLFTAVSLSIRNVVRVDLRAEAHKMAANIQAVYNRAVTRNCFYRMVFDFEENLYFSELAEKRFFLGATKEEDEDEPLFKAKDRKAQQRGEVQILETSDGPAMHQASAQEVRDSILRRVKLDRGLSLGGIMTTHQREVRREGKGYLYFFPNGYVEKALIYVTDDEQSYTIATQPLTGRVRVHRGELAPGSDFDEEEEDD